MYGLSDGLGDGHHGEGHGHHGHLLSGWSINRGDKYAPSLPSLLSSSSPVHHVAVHAE